MATALVEVTTPGTSIDAAATALEGETNISLAEVIGHQAEDGLTNAPASATASRNTVCIEVTGTTTTDITNAITAVGTVTLVPNTLV